MLPVNQRRGRNNKARGKSYERVVARLLAQLWQEPVWRNPDTGGKVADCESAVDVVEVKSVTGPSYALLLKAWGQAEAAAAETGKTPHVVLSFVDNGRRVFWHVQKLEERKSA